MTDSTYRFVCEELDAVLLIKILSPADEEKLYTRMRNGLIKAEGIVEISSYKQFLVEELVSNYEDFIGSVDEDREPEDYIEAAYECLVTAFPAYSIEFVCADINKAAFVDAYGDVIPDNLKDIIGKYKALSGTDCFDPPLATKKQILDLSTNLQDNIIGQTQAISTLCRGLKVRASGLGENNDLASFLFVGPTGVGKTELAKIVGEHFDGNLCKVNCAEYASSHEYAKLIGTPPGYLGHDKKSILAEKAEESNAWVFLFDEIEKAHHKLYDVLLSLLDDGTCTDSGGQTLDFSKSIFIFTSNKGMDEVRVENTGFASYRKQAIDSLKAQTQDTIHASLKTHFKPEFLNRIDEIVVFNQLNEEEVREIVEINLDYLPVEITEDLIDEVCKEAYSVEYGARNVRRYIKSRIAPAVADAILDNKMPLSTDFYKVERVGDRYEVVDLGDFEEKAKLRADN